MSMLNLSVEVKPSDGVYSFVNVTPFINEYDIRNALYYDLSEYKNVDVSTLSEESKMLFAYTLDNSSITPLGIQTTFKPGTRKMLVALLTGMASNLEDRYAPLLIKFEHGLTDNFLRLRYFPGDEKFPEDCNVLNCKDIKSEVIKYCGTDMDKFVKYFYVSAFDGEYWIQYYNPLTALDAIKWESTEDDFKDAIFALGSYDMNSIKYGIIKELSFNDLLQIRDHVSGEVLKLKDSLNNTDPETIDERVKIARSVAESITSIDDIGSVISAISSISPFYENYSEIKRKIINLENGLSSLDALILMLSNYYENMKISSLSVRILVNPV